MTIQRYDFSRPARLAGEPARTLDRWLRGACALAAGECARRLPFQVEVGLRELDVLGREETLIRLPEAAVAYRASVAGDTLALLALPRPLVLTLVGGLLGDAGGRLAPDRELTPVEEALCEYLVQDVLLPALQAACPSAGQARVEMRQREPHPRWTRALPPDEPVVATLLAFRGPFGEQVVHWLVPRKPLLALLSPPAPEGAPQQDDPRSLLESHVRGLPVSVSVSLGSAEVPLAQLARLQAGDVVVLSQGTADALTASVAGKTKFRVWCGRVGSRQAFQVDSVIES